MRHRYIITYDICSDERLRRIHRTMKGAGEWLQYSVFQCDLSDRDHAELLADLSRLINHREDQVLFIDLGPSEGPEATEAISALGRPYVQRERKVPII